MCMAHTHALSGAALFLAATPILAHSTAMPATQIVTGTLVCAGAAMLPDLDHPSASIAHTFGPLTRTVAVLVEKVSGGHRHATHSLLAVAFAGLGAHALALVGGWPLAVVVWLLIGLALRAGLRMHGLLNIGVAAAATWLLLHGHPEPRLLGATTAVGYLAHLVGDCLTVEGCPLLWPLPQRFEVPLLRTDSRVERIVVAPVLGLAVALLAWKASGHRVDLQALLAATGR